MKRVLPLFAALALSSLACTPAKSPVDRTLELETRLSSAFDRAFEVASTEDADQGVDALLALLGDSVDKGESGVAPTLAALDELVWRTPVAGASFAPVPGVAFRSKRWPDLAGKLEALALRSNHGVTTFALQQALLDLARYRGDEKAASVARAGTMTFGALAVAGPLAPVGVAALASPTALEEAELPRSVKGDGPFGETLAPALVDAEDGVVDPMRASSQPGVYAAAGDVVSDRDAEGFVVVRAAGPFVLASGKAVVVARAPKDGFGWMARVARVRIPKGRSRLVARVLQGDDPSKVAVSVLAPGATVTLSAPAAGERADGVVAGEPWELRGVGAVRGAAMLSLGDVYGARAALEGRTELSATLLATVPVATSPDVPFEKRAERLRILYAKARAASPRAWEAVAGEAALAAVRKGAGEARFELLAGLPADGGPVLRAVRASVAATASLRDVAKEELAAVKAAYAGTPFGVVLEGRVVDVDAPAREARACLEPLADKQTLACAWEKRRRGDHPGAVAELVRLRALRGSPTLYREDELRIRMSQGAWKDVEALYRAMLPGERSVLLLGAFGDKRALTDPDRAKARDAVSIGPLLHLAAGTDLGAAQKRGREAVTSAGAKEGDATSVLLHDERWVLEKDGFLRYVIHDVRRVGGTSDVERGGAAATFASVWGRDARRMLYRRIHKKDGRLLEPDRPRNAEQADADLSQLEPGDTVEQLVEGVAMPDRLGHLVVDTPDLLPERTAVRSARVELEVPKGLDLVVASSPRLGAAVTSEGPATKRWTWKLDGAAPRTFEDGVPRMDRDVSVSFGTYRWAHIARAFADYVEASEDRDPVVAKWAETAAGQGTDAERLARVVTAAGKAVRVANGSLLSDAAAATGPGALRARAILDLGQGSRTWLVHRALASLGIKHDLALAEREPFSQNPDFPARPGRYDRPVLIAHLGSGDVHLDLDVQGPPLPPGELSPELLGRTALLVTGKTIELPKQLAQKGDEVTLDVTVDARGDAQGTIHLDLRGRSAQALLDALDTVVGTDRRELLRRVVLGWLPWATVDEVKLTSPEGATFVSLDAKVVLPAYLQREGKAWVLGGIDPVHFGYPAPGTATMRGALTTKGERGTALVVSTSQRWVLRRKVTLPPGFAVTRAPSAKPETHDLVRATRTTKVEGAVVDETFSLEVAVGAVQPSGYQAFSALAKRVDDAFLSGVRLSGP